MHGMHGENNKIGRGWYKEKRKTRGKGISHHDRLAKCVDSGVRAKIA